MSAVTVTAAARNNAEWCDTVCRAHGTPGTFGAGAWTTSRRSPPFYPDAVTLAPNVVGDHLLRCVDASVGCSVKDSFATLELASDGFRILFEADWIGRAGAPPRPEATRPAGDAS